MAAAATVVALPTFVSFSYRSNRLEWRSRRIAVCSRRNVPPRASAETDAPAPAAAATSAFADLAAARLDRSAVALAPCGPQGNGLVLAEPVVAGQVVLRVPLDTCLAVNYAEGLSLPPGQWPRLRKGVAKDNSLPWDVLLVRPGVLNGSGACHWRNWCKRGGTCLCWNWVLRGG